MYSVYPYGYIHSYEKKLIEKNRNYWRKSSNITNGKRWIYVFHGIPCEWEFSIHEDIVAKGLQEKLKLPIAAISYKENRKSINELDSSFGVKHRFNMGNGKNSSFISKVRTFFVAKYFACTTYKKKEKLFQIKYRGVECGDTIHDEIVRMNQGVGFDCFDVSFKSYCQFIREAFSLIEECYHIFRKRKPEYVITSECIYTKGLLVSAAMLMGAKVLILPPDSADIILELSPGKALFKERKMGEIIQKQIEEYAQNYPVERTNKNDFFVLKMKEGLENSLCKRWNFLRKRKNIFIMLHALNDASRTSYFHNIYSDYNEWFIDTIRIIKEIKDVNWIIKDHPLSDFYGQGSYVKKVFEKNKTDNMYWCDKDVSGMQIKEIADCVITSAGDVGIEYWAYGIPTITVSETYYNKWGISYNMKSLKQYEHTLRHIAKIKKPSIESSQQAQKYLLTYKNMNQGHDKLSNLFSIIRNRQKENLKKGNVDDVLLHNKFSQEYIFILENNEMKNSSMFQLKNLYKI